MALPLAYVLSWTTKGAWLPGDPRGWVLKDVPGIRAVDAQLHEAMKARMCSGAVVLDEPQRLLVERTCLEHCEFRGWRMHAVNARSNHVHIVLTANDVSPEQAMSQLKAWCSRRLNEHDRHRDNTPLRKWWTPHGSTRWINDHDYLANAIEYVLYRQECANVAFDARPARGASEATPTRDCHTPSRRARQHAPGFAEVILRPGRRCLG